MKNFQNTLSVSSASLVFTFCVDSGRLTATEARSGRLLFKTEQAFFLRPAFNGLPTGLRLQSVRAEEDRVLLSFEGQFLSGMSVEFSASTTADAIDVSCKFVPAETVQLNRIEILPEGTALNMVDVFNFRNRHHTAATAPELLLGGAGCQTDTYSGDWQFAPHPSALVFRTSDAALFCGSLDITKAFGMYFSAKDYRVCHWFLNYGDFPCGEQIAAGETFESPRFRFFFRPGTDAREMYSEFGDMLVGIGSIPRPAETIRHAWWHLPTYCTWVDQIFGSNAELQAELSLQAQGVKSAVTFLDEEMVLRAADCIRRERLPIQTLIIDDGWQVARGEWEPDPKRFGNMRKLVDELHARDFKVVVWWNWAEIDSVAQAEPAHLAGENWLNRHGQRVRDYSNPRTQEEYLKPLFKRLFSSGAEGLDLDGVKTDFLADKIHPEMPLHDPGWRGEENYFRHVTQLFCNEMKAHKANAVHIGGCGNYWLAQFVDVNRTYDVTSSNWREHEQRAKMLAATSPGTPVAYDFHLFTENLEQWFESARKNRAGVQIGNVLWTKRDRFSVPEAAGSDHWDVLRRELNLKSN